MGRRKSAAAPAAPAPEIDPEWRKLSCSPPRKDDALPPHWTKVASKSKPGVYYYYNDQTMESTFDEPRGPLMSVFLDD